MGSFHLPMASGHRLRGISRILLVFLVALSILLLASPASGAAFVEWNIPGGASSAPYDLVVVGGAPDIWFTEYGSFELGRFSYGLFTEYQLPAGSFPWGIGFDGDYIWFTESVGYKIGRIRASGEDRILEYIIPSSYGGGLRGIYVQNKTRVWFADYGAHSVGLLRISPAYVDVVEWKLPGWNESPSSGPQSVIFIDGTGAWFVDYDLHRIGNIPDPESGIVREWQLPPGTYPWDLAADSSGNIWFTESGRDRIGKLNPNTNEITEYITVTGSQPFGIAIDYSNRVWFAEHGRNAIGRYVPGDSAFTEFTRYGSGAPLFVAVHQDGRPPVYFTDAVWNKLGRLDPYVEMTTTFVTGLSSATTTSTTTIASSTSLSSETTGFFSFTYDSANPTVSRTELATTSTSYAATETVSVVRTSSLSVTTILTTVTSATTAEQSTTLTATSTSYVSTVYQTTTRTATYTTYVSTVTMTMPTTVTYTQTTETSTMTPTTTYQTTRTGTPIPGYPVESIAGGFAMGFLLLILIRSRRARKGQTVSRG